jgi:hypothetical protein
MHCDRLRQRRHIERSERIARRGHDSHAGLPGGHLPDYHHPGHAVGGQLYVQLRQRHLDHHRRLGTCGNADVSRPLQARTPRRRAYPSPTLWPGPSSTTPRTAQPRPRLPRSTWRRNLGRRRRETIEAIADRAGLWRQPGRHGGLHNQSFQCTIVLADFLTVEREPSVHGQSTTSSPSPSLLRERISARPVSFACSGLPSGDACSFAPSTVTPAGAAVSSVP